MGAGVSIIKTPNYLNDPTIYAHNTLYKLPVGYWTTVSSMMNTVEIMDKVKYIFANPYEVIRSVRMYPFDVPDEQGGETSQKVNFKLGLYDFTAVDPSHAPTVFTVSSVSAPISLGKAYVEPYYNNFMDYSPYTKIQLYLPYIGFVTLDASQVMGHWLRVEYVIDYVLGTCTAYTILQQSQSMNDDVDMILSIDRGIIAATLPTLSTNEAVLDNQARIARELADKQIDIKTRQAGFGALGGLTTVVAGALTGNVLAIIGGLGATVGTAIGAGTGIAGINASTAASIAGLESHFGAGGSPTGIAGWYAPQRAMLYITRTTRVQNNQNDYVALNGLPSGRTEKLSEVHGYTEVSRIHLDAFTEATVEELAEMEQLLKAGVILP